MIPSEAKSVLDEQAREMARQGITINKHLAEIHLMKGRILLLRIQRFILVVVILLFCCGVLQACSEASSQNIPTSHLLPNLGSGDHVGPMQEQCVNTTTGRIFACPPPGAWALVIYEDRFPGATASVSFMPSQAECNRYRDILAAHVAADRQHFIECRDLVANPLRFK